jgi:hypothetical protein
VAGLKKVAGLKQRGGAGATDPAGQLPGPGRAADRPAARGAAGPLSRSLELADRAGVDRTAAYGVFASVFGRASGWVLSAVTSKPRPQPLDPGWNSAAGLREVFVNGPLYAAGPMRGHLPLVTPG